MPRGRHGRSHHSHRHHFGARHRTIGGHRHHHHHFSGGGQLGGVTVSISPSFDCNCCSLRGFLGFQMYLAPVLVIIGTILLVLAPNPSRQAAIFEYNNAVNNWAANNYYSSLYSANGQFSVRGKTSLVTLPIKTSKDSLNDGNPADLADYSPVCYSTTISMPSSTAAVQLQISGRDIRFPAPPTSTYSAFSTSQGDGIPIEMRGVASKQALGNCRTIGECSISDQACFDREYCDSACADRQGTWSYFDNTCTLTYYLQTLCFLVEQFPNNSSWTLSQSSVADFASDIAMSRYLASGKAGCYYESASSVGINNSSGIPSNFPAVYGTNRPRSVLVEMRSRYDPYVAASRITNGTYDFGGFSQQMAVAGLALLITGLVLVGMFFIGVVYSIKCLGLTARQAMPWGSKPMATTATNNSVQLQASAPLSASPSSNGDAPPPAVPGTYDPHAPPPAYSPSADPAAAAAPSPPGVFYVLQQLQQHPTAPPIPSLPSEHEISHPG